MKYLNISLLLIISFLAFGCGGNLESRILYDFSFEQTKLAASSENKPFCVVLVDSSMNMTELYRSNLLDTYTTLPKRAFFNIVDISAPKNRWFEEWLCPISVPLTCIFSASGELTDLIAGMSYEGFSYMEEVLKTGRMNTALPCRNRFGMTKEEYVAFMSDILQVKIKIEQGHDAGAQADSTIAVYEYPFNLGLLLENQLWLNDTMAARESAERLLAIGTPYNMLNFPSQYKLAKEILDPDYDEDSEPYLELLPKTISLGECSYEEIRRFEVTIKNTGAKNLVISDVVTSCSCLNFLGEKEFTVKPGEYVSVPFEFIAETIGNIERGAYFVSNAKNPVADFTLFATVKKQ